MARINTNVASLISQHNLNKSSGDLQVRLQRLSTGLRINRGADDPAGLIISERLRSEVQGVTQAIDNAERASNVLATTEAARPINGGATPPGRRPRSSRSATRSAWRIAAPRRS